jgi:hypothetical protein
MTFKDFCREFGVELSPWQEAYWRLHEAGFGNPVRYIGVDAANEDDFGCTVFAQSVEGYCSYFTPKCSTNYAPRQRGPTARRDK